MALNLLVLVKREKAYEGLQEAGLNDRRLVCGVNRDVADTGGGRENERKVRRVQETKKGLEAIRLHNVDLVLLWGC